MTRFFSATRARTQMLRCILLWLGVAASAGNALAVPKKSLPTIGAAQYAASLRQLEAALGLPSPRRAQLQKLAPKPALVQRNDRQSQQVDNGQLQRALGKARKDGRLSKHNAEMLGASLAARRAELERWQRAEYQSADAGSIIAQLAASGQIRVGPTAWQLWIKSVRDWWSATLDKISKWIFGNAPKITPAKLPSIDERWIKFFFYSSVFSLLAIIAFMVWKALGGRIGRREARLSERVLEGEDAELLKLPSDELIARAARFAGETNYREAVRHRFIATLVRFDERALWRYNTRRTNREHIAILRGNTRRAELAPPLETLTRRFDRVRYGGATVSSSDWIRFESDSAALEGLPAAQAAAIETRNASGGVRA
jgi:hypothetical protein